MRALFLASLLLAGCAGPEGFPSLAQRPIESRPETIPAPPEPVAAPDPALDGQIAELTAALAAAASAFRTAAARVERSVLAGRTGGVGSEAWITAQTALSAMEGARASSTAALVDLEQLAIARAAAGLPPYPALQTALAAAEEQAREQDQRFDALRGRLPAL